MMGSSGFPIDLVLFAMIAGFLVLRLRGILGRRTGFERQARPYQSPGVEQAPTIDGRAEPVAQAARATPDPASPVGQTIARMQRIDRTFDPERFLDGAEQAFRMIVEAFAAGNREPLRNLLSEEMYRAFSTVIDTREQAGQRQKTEIRTIQSATIEEAELRDNTGSLTVRFVSDQVSVTNDRDGQIVAGAESVTEITDIWTFERDLTARDPTWRLIAAR
ncbi:MAG: Tim44 domain-containing protein [Acetobacteraceae bacterium]|nr:Tim44 domain-containing protein [Acetobacteraceae bacterium]